MNEQVFWLRGHPSGPAFSRFGTRWFNGAFVTRYSGATARDLHPVPYSPATVAAGTQSGF